MVSTIHIVNTLKSVNDTGLSDWEGVIGDILEEQKEAKLEKEEIIYELAQRLEPLLENELTNPNISSNENVVIRQEVNEIRKDLKSLVLNMGISNIPIRTTKKILKRDANTTCPICEQVLIYKQRPLKNSFKPIKCSGCENNLISKFNKDSGEFFAEKRELKGTKFSCPECSAECEANVDTLPHAVATTECKKCHNIIKVSQKNSGELSINKAITKIPSKIELSEELLNSIKQALPTQPWPRGIHRDVGKQLGLSPSIVWKGIDTLVRQGDFKRQYDGVLYSPEPVTTKEKTN